MPKARSHFNVDISSIVSTLFLTWVVLQLLHAGIHAICSLRQTTETKNHDENAWAWRRTILDDLLLIFSCIVLKIGGDGCKRSLDPQIKPNQLQLLCGALWKAKASVLGSRKNDRQCDWTVVEQSL
ncbi:hypothetical protein ACFE04_011275 [Oxalis oulophora]